MKVRRASALAVGVVGTGYLAWRAHRAAQRALADVLVLEAQPVEPITDEIAGEIVRRLFGRASGSSAPPLPGAGGVHHGEGWPGLLHYFDTLTDDWQTQFPVLDWDPISFVQDQTDYAIETFDGIVALGDTAFSTLMSFFDDIWGAGFDLASDFIEGAANVAARILGLATGEQVHKLANYVHTIVNQTRSTIGQVQADIATIFRWIADIKPVIKQLAGEITTLARFTADGLFGLSQTVVTGLALLQQEIDELSTAIQHLPDEIPEIDPGVLVPQIVEIITTLTPEIVLSITPQVLQNVTVEVLAHVPKDLTELDPDAARRLADDEACCAANTDAWNKAKPDLDQLKKLLDLLAGLLLVGSMDDILDAIRSFLGGGGSDVESQLLGWLGLDG